MSQYFANSPDAKKCDASALDEYAEDTESPSSFAEWISDIYYFFRTRTMNAPLNINENNLPESYPM